MNGLIFEIEGLPKIAANANGNWRGRFGEAKKWKRLVHNAVVLNRLVPATPITKAKLICTRFAFGKKPDFENLAHSFKHIIDGLVEANVLIDDNQEIIGQPEYKHEPAKGRQGKVRIEIYDLS